MMRLRQLAPILAILLAFAAGFGARRSAQKDAEPEPVSDGEGIVEPQVSDPRPTAIAQGKGLLRLTAERFEAGDVLGSATALYQWLRESDSDTMTEFIDSLIELDETGDSPGFWGDDRAEEFFPIIVMRIAETDAEYVSEQLGEDENLASSALAAAELRGDPAAALADAPDSMLDFCRQFIAARHAEFNLPAAKELEVPLDWYVGIWLHRGLDPAVLLRDEESLDTDVVRAIVRDQMKERDVDAIKAFVDKIEDPQLLETVRSCVGEVLQTDLKKALESLKLLSVLDLAFPEQKGGGASISLWHYYHAALSERPTETIEWLMSFSPEKRKAALSHIFTNSLSGSTNTTAWLELYRRLPREELPEFMSLHLYLRSLIRGDPEATLDWFEA